MIARLRRAAQNDDGASAVEFAFIGTLIVIPLVFGAISFGMVFGGNLSLSNSARQAARIGTVIGADTTTPNDCADIVNEARTAAPAIGLVSTKVSIEVIRDLGDSSQTLSCKTDEDGNYISGTSGSTVPCVGSATDSQVTVYVRSHTPLFFIPPYFFKTNGYPVEGKGVYRCEFS